MRINTHVNSFTCRTGSTINSGKDDPASLIASENLRGDIHSVNQALSNEEPASNRGGTADDALGSVKSLINDLGNALIANDTVNARSTPASSNTVTVESGVGVDNVTVVVSGNGNETGGGLTFTIGNGINNILSEINATGSTSVEGVEHLVAAVCTTLDCVRGNSSFANARDGLIGIRHEADKSKTLSGHERVLVHSVTEQLSGIIQILHGKLRSFMNPNVHNTAPLDVKEQSTFPGKVADLATESAASTTERAALTRAQILQQSGTAVLGLANQNPQSVLSLLRG